MSLIINSSEISKIYSGNKEISKLYDGSGNLLFGEEKKRREWFKLDNYEYPYANEICTDGEILFVTTNSYRPCYSYDGLQWEDIDASGSDRTTSDCSYVGDNFYFYDTLIGIYKQYKNNKIVYLKINAKGTFEYGNGMYVFYNSRSVMYSKDGVNFTNSDLVSKLTLNEYIVSIKFFKDKWICCTSASNYKKASIYYSTDGISWNTTSIKNKTHFNGLEICENKVVCYGAETYVSSNGIDWSLYELQLINNCNYANGKQFDMVQDQYLYCDMNETNIKWLHTVMGICSISYCEGQYIGEFDDGVYSSDDGLTWNKELDIQRERKNTKRPFIFKDKIYVTTEQGVYYTNL